jgi:hypothetical protein
MGRELPERSRTNKRIPEDQFFHSSPSPDGNRTNTYGVASYERETNHLLDGRRSGGDVALLRRTGSEALLTPSATAPGAPGSALILGCQHVGDFSASYRWSSCRPPRHSSRRGCQVGQGPIAQPKRPLLIMERQNRSSVIAAWI